MRLQSPNDSATRKPTSRDADGRVLKGYDIVCTSFVAWDDYWGTSQHLMSRLARHNRVLFVDPAVSPLSVFTRREGAAFVRGRIERWRAGPRELAANFYNATPPPALPLRYFGPTGAANTRILQRWLLRTAQRLGFDRPIFWNFLPSLASVAETLQPRLNVYHCVDDFAALPQWWNGGGASIQAQDSRCCVEADLVLCTAETLVQDRSALNPSVHLVANGAEVQDLLEAESGDEAAPVDIASLPRPVIGFSGIVDFRFDAGLVAYLARRRPDWSIVLVGGTAPSHDSGAPQHDGSGLAELAGLPNVHHVGWRSREQLPAYQRAMDACLIPFRRSRFVRGVLPLKFFEYLAAGRPVVSTDLEELRRFGPDLVRLADDPASFYEAIVAALEADTPALAEKRIAAAREHSWDRRVELASCLISRAIEDKYAAASVSDGGP